MGAPAKGRIESRGDSFVKLFAEREGRNNISLHNCVMEAIKHFRDLHVYLGGKALVMEIFEVSKTFPVEERYALTDQVRRSWRSICANLAEAWRKRRNPAA